MNTSEWREQFTEARSFLTPVPEDWRDRALALIRRTCDPYKNADLTMAYCHARRPFWWGNHEAREEDYRDLVMASIEAAAQLKEPETRCIEEDVRSLIGSENDEALDNDPFEDVERANRAACYIEAEDRADRLIRIARACELINGIARPADLAPWRAAEPVAWYCEGVLQPSSVTLVSARGGGGKSLLVLYMMLALASGRAGLWLDTFALHGKPLTGLLLDAECGEGRLSPTYSRTVESRRFRAFRRSGPRRDRRRQGSTSRKGRMIGGGSDPARSVAGF